MELYKHQQEIVTLNPSKHGLFWETGTGKTLAAIKLCSTGTTLVVCPKSLKDKWADDILQSADNSVDFMVVSKEEFKKKHLTLRCDNLIIDEIHYFLGYTSAMFKNTIAFLNRVKPTRFYGLSATPYRSTPFNVYCLARLFGKDWGWFAFKKHFFYDIPMGRIKVPQQKPNTDGELQKIIQGFGSFVKLNDCVDIPEPVFETELFDVTKEQMKGFDEHFDVLPIVRYTKEHQICGGILKDEGYGEQRYKSEKFARLLDLIKENKKVVVVCRYNAELDMIYKAIHDGKRFIYIINGETPNKQSVIDIANSKDDAIMLINASCSVGYELPTFPAIIFYSLSFSFVDYVQMLGRIQRINKIQKCFYLHLVVKGTVDYDIFERITVDRKDFQADLYGEKTWEDEQ